MGANWSRGRRGGPSGNRVFAVAAERLPSGKYSWNTRQCGSATTQWQRSPHQMVRSSSASSGESAKTPAMCPSIELRRVPGMNTGLDAACLEGVVDQLAAVAAFVVGGGRALDGARRSDALPRLGKGLAGHRSRQRVHDLAPMLAASRSIRSGRNPDQ